MISIIVGIIQVLLYNPIPDSNFVELSQGSLAYAEFGEGENTLILIHGSPGSSEDFSLLAPEIKNRKVYALDMYGFGESEKFVDNYGISAQADYLKEFMDTKNISSASILGFSWGGGVAIEFAYKYPKYTDNLILLSSMGIQEGEPTGSYFLEQLRAKTAYLFVVFYPGAFAGNAYWRDGFMMSFIDSDQRPIREHMKNIISPTLILHGDGDTIVEPWVAEEHHSLLKNSILVYYEGSHGEIFSNVTEVAEIIDYYLKTRDKDIGKVLLEVEE